MTMIAGTPLPPPESGENAPAPGLSTPSPVTLAGADTEITVPRQRLPDEPPSDFQAPPPTEGDDTFGHRPGDVVLDRYRLVKALGQGGMGTVFLAEDDLTGQKVAIKALPPSLAREKGIRERFRHEAQALAALDHPNIVPLITYAERNEERFLVMKCVEGQALDALVEERGHLDFDLAREVFSKVVGALGYAHDRGVIHRDVKPANVLIAEDGRVYLVDFGIAKKEESTKLTQTGMLMGTPQYMSPEQISGLVVDGRSDLYAAGLLLFEMLTGRPPFVSDRTFAILRAHVDTPPPDPERLRGEAIPPDLLAVTKRLLEKDRDRRPSTAADVFALMEQARDNPIAELEQRPTPLTTEFDPGEEDDLELDFRPRRSPWLALGVAAVFTGLALGVGLAVFAPGADITADVDETAASDAGAVNAEETAATAMLFEKAEDALGDGEGDRALALFDTAPESARESVRGKNLALAIALEREDATAARAALTALEALEPVDRPVALVELSAAVSALEAKSKKPAATGRKKRARKKRRRYADLSNKQIQRVTMGRKSRTQVQNCWERTVLRKDPAASGQMRIEVEIKPSGSVRKASIQSQTVGGKALGRCMMKVARRWKFPAYRGDPIVITQVFDLVPKD